MIFHQHLQPSNDVAQQPTPPPVASNYVAPPVATTSSAPTANIDFDHCSKLCRYAVSALQYEDVDGAVSHLAEALSLLQKR